MKHTLLDANLKHEFLVASKQEDEAYLKLCCVTALIRMLFDQQGFSFTHQFPFQSLEIISEESRTSMDQCTHKKYYSLHKNDQISDLSTTYPSHSSRRKARNLKKWNQQTQKRIWIGRVDKSLNFLQIQINPRPQNQ